MIENADAPGPHDSLHWAWGNGWAVRKGDWKLVGNRETPKELLWLKGTNPERKNFLTEKPDLTARLHGLHRSWLKSVLR